MAIFVRWEWKERTKTFLVIFYFVDDRTKQNLRFRLKVVDDWKECIGLEYPENNPDCSPTQSAVRWRSRLCAGTRRGATIALRHRDVVPNWGSLGERG